MQPTLPTLCPSLAPNREMCPLQYGWNTQEAPRKKLNHADYNLPISVHKIPNTHNMPSNKVLINPDIVDTDICEDNLNEISLTSDIYCMTLNEKSLTHDFPA